MRLGIAALIALGIAMLLSSRGVRASASQYFTLPQSLFPADDVSPPGFAPMMPPAQLPHGIDMTPEQNLAAFLYMIRAAEGTADANGYARSFSSNGMPEYFLEMDTHPAIRTYGEWAEEGKTTFTTAAGAYQITASNWRKLAARMGLTDFSPQTQDAMAVELIRERGALPLVQAGRFDEAVARVAPVWASLPGSPYPQARRSLDFVRAAYAQAGGEFA